MNEIKMKPILFNTLMVQAILGGRKTQTRRLLKPQPLFNNDVVYRRDDGKWFILPPSELILESEIKSPYAIGDILYVRETFKTIRAWSGSEGSGCEIVYAAGGSKVFDKVVSLPKSNDAWTPSIHMPKEAARIFLRVTNIRAERLQDDEEYGIEEVGRYVWDKTIKPADLCDYRWDANPWVWIIEFKRISKEEAYGR